MIELLPLRQEQRPLLLEELNEMLQPVIEKIERLSQEKISRIGRSTLQNVFVEFKKHPFTKKTLIALALPAYLALLGIGTLTSYASINLLYNADLSSALSSDPSVEVNIANTTTNSGAIFACLTDFPAISYCFWLYIFKGAYREAVQKALSEGYHSGIEEFVLTKEFDLTPEMHKALYDEFVSKLQSLDLDRFYINPDPLSVKGALYKELAPILEDIDLELSEGIPLNKLVKESLRVFRNESWKQKIAKLAAGTICLGFMGLSTFIILENGILLKNTPDGDLFIGNSTAQTNEAFYLTQLGGFFSSLTAFGASAYANFLLFVKTAYQNSMRKRIQDCFIKYTPDVLRPELRDELYLIKQHKLKKIG